MEKDQIPSLRPVLAASHGTLAELGVLPILLSAFLFQILAAQRKIDVNLALRSDRRLFQSFQKQVAFGIAIVFSLLLVLSGNYGQLSALGARNALFLVIQLVASSVFLILLDEILQKGYGYGTGILIFTSLRCSQIFTWSLIGLGTLPQGSDSGYEGIIPHFVSRLSNHSIRFAFVDSVFRGSKNEHLSNFKTLGCALVVFFVVLYLSFVRLNLVVRSTKMRATSTVYPVRLLYTGALPLVYSAAVLASFSFLKFAVKALGVRAQVRNSIWYSSMLNLIDASGFQYAIGVLEPVVRVILFTAIASCFARQWLDASDSAPRDVARQLKANNLVLLGYRDASTLKELKAVIPKAAQLGSIILGLIVASSDMLSPGTAFIVSVGVLNVLQIYELLGQENVNSSELGMGMSLMNMD